MKKTILLCVLISLASTLIGCAVDEQANKRQWIDTDTGRWLVHDMNRPAPPVITPGINEASSQPPSDAVVLFDGTSLSGWKSKKPWVLGDGYLETVEDAGTLSSKKEFGSCQLHVEFATPIEAKGRSQGRGNSGVFLMGIYEVQVLDSYNNRTYPDGQCGALYGRHVPLVNACRKPGQWQSYDIVFHRPIFKGNKVVRKARFTVFHNGALIHDNAELQGSTNWTSSHSVSSYKPHGDKGPISLQDHGNPVRFRNIWVRELAD